MLRGRQTLSALVLGCLIVGLLSDTASASLWLEFSARQAAPGNVVEARTLYTGAFTGIPAEAPPVRVFLVPADAVSLTSPEIGVTAPNDPRLIELGALIVDKDGNGELVFTVPDAPAGEYTTVTHCVPCAPYSAGRELLATGPTRPFVILENDEEGFPVAAALGAAIVLLLGASTVVLVRSRMT